MKTKKQKPLSEQKAPQGKLTAHSGKRKPTVKPKKQKKSPLPGGE